MIYEHLEGTLGKNLLTKKSNEVSWTQEIPTASLNFIHTFNLPKDAAILDVGGGESRLVDFLLDEGFTNIPYWIFQNRHY